MLTYSETYDGVTFRGEGMSDLTFGYSIPANIFKPFVHIIMKHIRADHGALITNITSSGIVSITSDRYFINLDYNESAIYDANLDQWHKVEQTDKSVTAQVCTCGVKFSGGLCSDWCDLLRTA